METEHPILLFGATIWVMAKAAYYRAEIEKRNVEIARLLTLAK